MTPQQAHIYAYIREYGFAHPAKLIGSIYKGKKFPAELSKRCRELRAQGYLQSHQDGKFEKYYLPIAAMEKIKEIMSISPFKKSPEINQRLI